MKTLEQIKEICRRDNNFGMNEEEYKIFDKYTTMLDEAWKEWDDDVTRDFWKDDEKPEKPTESFKEDYYNNFEFEEEFEYVDMQSFKESVLSKIEFTEVEYKEKTSGESYATFDEFVDKIIKDTIEYNGTIEDAVFIANDAYSKL